MKLTINGKLHEMDTATLAMLLNELGYQDTTIATALNGDFIPEIKREELPLKEGDRIEILAPMKGG